MDRPEVIRVLESLANGVDPGSGARIPIDAFHGPDTVRALFTASALLAGENGSETRRAPAGSTKLTAAGARWTEEEDARVCAEFDAGMTVAQIALEHGRSSGGITLRLVKLGRIDPATVKLRDRASRAAS
jgi:hypothetical protein